MLPALVSSEVHFRINWFQQSSHSQNVAPGLATSVSPRNFLEMRILSAPDPTPTESEILGDGTQWSSFNKPSGVTPMHAKVWDVCLSLWVFSLSEMPAGPMD